MTQEDKELLLKDLCVRFPYGVKIEYAETKKQYRLHELSEDGNYFSLLHETEPTGLCSELGIEYEGKQTIKPYLRQMSSMTDEERDEFRSLGGVMSYSPEHDHWAISAFSPEAYDYLNSHYFDYRGLIEKGLALEAPKGMYGS